METLQEFASQLWGRVETKFIVGHVMLNVCIALTRAFSSGTFSLRKLSGFLYDKLVPYLGVFAIATQFEDAIGMPGLSAIVWGLIQVNLTAQSIDSLGRLGVPIPEKIMAMTRWHTSLLEPDKSFDRIVMQQRREKAEIGD